MHNLKLLTSSETYIRLYVLYISVTLLSLSVFNQPLFSQDSNKSNALLYKESLIINTDRDIYITGEKVWFNVITISSLTHSPANISKVVYVEFLDKNNFPLRQLKVSVENCSGSSVFIIPENLVSGNYVIRAYTNWMQNWSPDQFYHKTISIVNPFGSFENLVLQSQSTVELLTSPVTNNNEISNISGVENRINYQIILNKQVYTSREKVKVEIIVTDEYGKPIESDLTVAIAKSGIINSGGYGATSSGNLKLNSSNTLKITGSDYLPELEGNLISGTIRMKDTGEPLRNSGISLSYVGKIARCQFSRTNDVGEFFFVTKEPGTCEIVIQPLDPETGNYYIDLKQSFNSNFSNFRPPSLTIDSSNIETINNAVLGMQINNLYEPFRQKVISGQKNRIPDFYGKPENTILLADYIELTSVREVVKEIIPNVYTLRQNGKHDLKLINKFQSLPFENKPLVLVDGIPVYDFEKVLIINSKEIERADVINKRYFFSEFIFDGILSFVTKKGNLSAMEFDNSVFRQVYEGCQPKIEFCSPEYSTDSLKSSRIPDYRNTLYWNPGMQTEKDGKTFIEFYTSDESSDYTIVVKGISSDGKTGYSTAVLKVQ